MKYLTIEKIVERNDDNDDDDDGGDHDNDDDDHVDVHILQCHG